MRAPESKSYSPPFDLGKPITNRGIAKVLKSDRPEFKEGDIIIATDSLGTEEYTAFPKGPSSRAKKLENPYNLDPRIFVGALGMPGLTAWSSLSMRSVHQRKEKPFSFPPPAALSDS